MKNSVLITIVLSVTLFSEASCRGGENTLSPDGKMVLTMYNYRNKTAANSVEFDIILDKFYERHPDVKFEIEELFNEPWHQKLQAMAAGGQLPDIIRLYPGERTGYVTKHGLVKDLRPYLGDEKDNFAPTAMSPQGPNGEIYELPSKVGATHVVYTNEKLLQRLSLSYPGTIEEMYDQAEIIKSAGYIPIAMSNKDGWQMQSTLLSVLVERTGGMKWLDGAITGQNSFDDPEFINALDVIHEFSVRGLFPAGVNQMDYPQGTELFVQEKAVYYIDGDWKIEELAKTLSEEQKGYVNLNVIPKLPNEQGAPGSSSGVAGTGFAMNTKLEGAEAGIAWDWIWLYSGPVGSRIHMGQGIIPAYRIDPSGLAVDKMTQKLIDFQANTPMGYVLDDAMDAEGMGLLQPLIQEMMFGSKTVEQVASSYEAWVAENDSRRK